MAVSPVIANCVEVRLLGICNAEGMYNVLHAQVQSGLVVNQALANTLGAAIKTSWTTNMAPRCPSNTAIVRVGVRDLRVANQAEFLDTGAAVTGTGTGDPLPGSVAAVATLRTALAGKSYRGRVYFSGFSEAENDVGGKASAAVATAIVNFMTAVSNNMTASQMTLAVASRPAERTTIVRTIFHNDGTTSTKTLSDVKAKSGAVTPVTAIASRTASWESQRRRINTRGVAPSLAGSVFEVHL